MLGSLTPGAPRLFPETVSNREEREKMWLDPVRSMAHKPIPAIQLRLADGRRFVGESAEDRRPTIPVSIARLLVAESAMEKSQLCSIVYFLELDSQDRIAG